MEFMVYDITFLGRQMGDILSVICDFHGVSYHHYGFAVGDGRVIHASKVKGKVVEESEAEFSAGKPITVCRAITSNDKVAAYQRVKSQIGKSYHLFADNCEHFVRWGHGLKKESRQIQKYALASVGGGIAIKSQHPAVQAMGTGAALGSLMTPEHESPVGYAIAGAMIAGGIAAVLSQK